MIYELRRYKTRPGRRSEWVQLMESRIIPFQISKGFVVVGSFVSEEDDDTYVWIRRFADEDERKLLYAAVYESAIWKNDIDPLVDELLDREATEVFRLTPTPKSVLQ